MIKNLLTLMCFFSLHLFADQNLSVDDIYNQLVPEEKTRGLTIEKKTIDIHSIYFDYNSAKLKNESIETLNNIGKALTKDKKISSCNFEIIGHTDAKGGDSYNLLLSQQRASSVVMYLLNNFSIEAKKLKSIGMGESNLLPDISPEDAKNRRVEIINTMQCD